MKMFGVNGVKDIFDWYKNKIDFIICKKKIPLDSLCKCWHSRYIYTSYHLCRLKLRTEIVSYDFYIVVLC